MMLKLVGDRLGGGCGRENTARPRVGLMEIKAASTPFTPSMASSLVLTMLFSAVTGFLVVAIAPG